jgi:hypothetical protein
LLKLYDAIAQIYDDAGVRAWTVWVDPGDELAVRELSRRDHKLDLQSIAMAAEIAALVLPDSEDLDWSESRDAALVARINDSAYGTTLFPATGR